MAQAFQAQEKFASLDLGSNSFRLWIAQLDEHGVLQPIANHKFPVRLAAGVGADGYLSSSAQSLALEVIESFAKTIREHEVHAVRAVATSTFRVASNVHDLLVRAQALLGIPVEVVSGHEEARLIYKGASHKLPDDGLDRLVVDIGGGSTECVIGQGGRAKLVDSAAIGCVVLSSEFFPGGQVDKASMEAAIYRAEDFFAPMVAPYKRLGWARAYGTSGTAKSLTQVAQTHFGSDELTRPVLKQMIDLLVTAGHVKYLHVDGLKPERRPVLAGGLAVMAAAFEEFGIESLRYCQGALRQGALYDMIERRQGQDIQAASIQMLMRRYSVDAAQADRLASTAQALFEAVGDVVPARFVGSNFETALRVLGQAASLAEIGLAISHEDFNKHSHYILSQADIPGFSKPEQLLLARLTEAQNGSLKSLKKQSNELAELAMALCLRWASILHRQRLAENVLSPEMDWQEGRLRVQWSQRWHEQHPLTWATLQHEVLYWNAENVELPIDLVP
jgi:exopolyphosphatase / guanosine-5'-triphosphate,3'-diphosphate pyrophosphatase